MKKLMKAIAFATVMCMLLSTVAFASVASLTDPATKEVTVTVTGAEGTEPVSVVIVGADDAITQGSILYINQDDAVAGTATFRAIIDADVDAVDVYAGSASYADVHGTSEVVAKGLPVVEDAEIVVALTDVVAIADVEGAAGYVDSMGTSDSTGALVVLNIDLENVDAVEDMFWAIGIDNDADGAVDEFRYVKGDVDAFDVMGGSIEIALAFENAENKDIISAGAVFLINDADYIAADNANEEALIEGGKN